MVKSKSKNIRNILITTTILFIIVIGEVGILYISNDTAMEIIYVLKGISKKLVTFNATVSVGLAALILAIFFREANKEENNSGNIVFISDN